MLPSNVLTIALETRKYFESVAKREWKRPTLKGLCNRASRYLALKLKEAGHPVEIKHGNMLDARGEPANIFHTWTVFNNTHIIDLTATQFGYTDKVLISSVNSKRYIPI